MKSLVENFVEESGECRKCGRVLDECSNSPCQLGALISGSFSERTISSANLLVDAYCACLDHDDIGKMVVLRVSKRLTETARRKEAFTSVVFHSFLCDDHASSN